MDNKIGIHRDFYIGIGMVIFSAAWFVLALDVPGEPGFLPRALSVFMAVMGAIVVWQGLQMTRKARAESAPHQYAVKPNEIPIPLIVYGMMIGYLLLFQWLGYYVATIIFLIAVLKYLRAGSWKLILAITAGYLIVCFLMFTWFLKIPIYRIGIFGRFFRI